MLSPTDGWAAGDLFTRYQDGSYADHDLLMHFTGSRWEQADSSFINAEVYSISMTSPTDGWAVGPGAILHYTAGRWTQVFRPGVPDPRQSWPELYAVAMVSPREGWAVGQGGVGEAAMLHYLDGDWRDAAPRSADGYILDAISMASALDGWAVGTGGAILHRRQGGSWALEAAPGAWPWLLSVSAVSAGDAWAVGRGGTIIHYVQGQWQQVTSPVSDDLYAVKMVSPTEGWAVGNSVILHYRDAVWQRDPFPVVIGLRGIDMASPAEGWVVGGQGRFLHLENGTWSWYTP